MLSTEAPSGGWCWHRRWVVLQQGWQRVTRYIGAGPVAELQACQVANERRSAGQSMGDLYCLHIYKMHAHMRSQGRNKRDARQVSAASCVEMLLRHTPEVDFYPPTKQAAPTKNPNVKTGVSQSWLCECSAAWRFCAPWCRVHGCGVLSQA